MAGVRQSPEAVFRFGNPALVLQQVHVMANDGLIGVQALRERGGIEQRFRRFQKLSENRFHEHEVSFHGVEEGKRRILADSAGRTIARAIP